MFLEVVCLKYKSQALQWQKKETYILEQTEIKSAVIQERRETL